MATTKKPAAPQVTYQLHVALRDITPVIWRRLWIPGNLKLSKLDRVIQEAFGWTNSHLHEFRIAGERYGMTEIESMDGDEDLKDDKTKPTQSCWRRPERRSRHNNIDQVHRVRSALRVCQHQHPDTRCFWQNRAVAL